MMTFADWVISRSISDHETSCARDAWQAAVVQTLDALIDRGFIGKEYKTTALEEIAPILGED